MFLVADKSYNELIENFKTHGLATWDTAAMFIMLNSGSFIIPAYLLYLKDSGPKLTKFAVLYCSKLSKLVDPGALHDIHISSAYLSLSFDLIGDIEICCNDINIWYVLLSASGLFSVAFMQPFWASGLYYSLYDTGKSMRINALPSE